MSGRAGLGPLAELEPPARRRVRLAGLAAALLAVAVVLALGARLSRPLYDLWQNLSPAPAATGKVVVVAIDAESLRAIGGWPWSRFYLARLTEEISRRDASAVGLDLLLPEPDRLDPPRFADLYPELSPASAGEVRKLPSMDAVFARVIGRSPVVLARAGADARSFDALDRPPTPLPPEAQFSGPLPAGVAAYPQAVGALPILDGAALGHGLVNGAPDDDGVVRRVPLVARAAGVPTPGFALELARVAQDVDKVGLETAGGRLTAVRLGGRRIPAAADGRLALRFGDWRAIPTVPAADLLRRGLPDDLFKGRIVLVGLTSAGGSDVVHLPRGGETYGVFVQAQAVDAILRGDGLSRPRWAPWGEWTLGVLLTLGAGLAVARLSPVAVGAAAAGGTAAVLAASWAGFQAGLLLDPFPVLLPAATTAAATVAALFVEGRALQARLRAALEDQRLQAARTEGELAAAAEIQAGMLVPRADLAALSPAVDLDAVLQPARSVGGDLYDAFLLPDGRLCFMVGDVTGKGLPAALFMALAKSLARSLISRADGDLAAAVGRIDAELSLDNREAMGLTLLVGVLDAGRGRLDLCCAGHENPLVVAADGEVRETPLRGGPPLCVVPDFPYAVETLALGPGETLVLFTDGVTEAQDPEGTLWPREALAAAARAAAGAASAAAMVDALVGAVRTFEAGGEPSDDLTVLALRLKG
ncbi:CHASE2 domain-containing protein [Caulobacter sp. KR2-114]|uniref:CHASE2 domain-containing protein n=1 Tax=Caulobacter sp. KR2-114 TaxID=3400912 RepID=UPI003BFD5ABD